MKNFLSLVFLLLLTGCASESDSPSSTEVSPALADSSMMNAVQSWTIFTENAASQYGVEAKLINAIINVESGGNPTVISHSNAIGLMQIKASTAGREVWRARGQNGQPSTEQLRDPAINIDTGVAYLQMLQKRMLAGIKNPDTLRYATIVAYVNGAGALLRTFSPDRTQAITMINTMTPEEFYQHIQQKHPATQASRYLWKVNTAYGAI